MKNAKLFLLLLLSLAIIFVSCEETVTPQPEKFVVSGVVENMSGDPVPFVDITVRSETSVVSKNGNSIQSNIIASATTDEDGKFELKDLEENDNYFLEMNHSDFKVYKKQLKEFLKDQSDKKNAKVKYEKNEGCTGEATFAITDESENNLGGVEIRIFRGDKLIVKKKTELGAATAKELCEGDYNIRLAKDGYKIKEDNFSITSGEAKSFSFKLSQEEEIPDSCCTSTLLIKTQDEDGNSLDGVKVYLKKGDKVIQDPVSDNGQVSFDNVCEGTYWIRSVKDGYKVVEQEVTIECGEDKEVTLTFKQEEQACCNGKLTLTFTEKNSDKVVNNASVKMKMGGTVKKEKNTTNGTVILEELCEGKYVVYVSADGYNLIEYEVEIKCDDDKSITIELAAKNTDCCKGVFDFTLTDKDSKAVENALVKIYQNGKVVKEVKTNANGRIELEICEGTYSASTSKDGYKGIEFTFEIKCQETTKVSKQLESTTTDCCKGVFDFTLTDKDGKAIANAMVKIYQNGKVVKEVKTNDNGRIELEICEGTYSASATKDNYKGVEFTFEIKCQETTKVSKQLESATTDCCKGVFDFTLTDKDGKAIENAMVKIWQNGKVVKEVKTNANGRIELEICEGTYSASTSKDGYKGIEFNFEIKCQEATQIAKQLESSGTDCCKGVFDFTLKNKEGEVVSNAMVKIYQNGKVVKEVKTNTNGRIELEICEGKYDITVSRDGYKSIEFDMTITCKETTKVSKEIEGNSGTQDCCNAKLKFKVYSKDSKTAIEGATVTLMLNGTSVTGTTNADGWVMFENICNKKYSYKIEKDGYNTSEGFWNVEKCQDYQETFYLTK